MNLTQAQILLGTHLEELGFENICYEYQFDPQRKFRFDVMALYSDGLAGSKNFGFEVNGHWQGHHGRGWSEGMEKLNLAQAQGWRVFCFHNKDVLNGKAKQWLSEHLVR